MAEELDNVKQYVADVARLIAAGQFEQALQLPFPSLDPVGHMKAITNALKEIPRLAAKLPGQWNDIHDQTSQALGQTGQDIDRALNALYEALTALNEAGDHFSSDLQEDLDAVNQKADAIRDLLKTIPTPWETRPSPLWTTLTGSSPPSRTG